jgi:hypothetical protein
VYSSVESLNSSRRNVWGRGAMTDKARERKLWSDESRLRGRLEMLKMIVLRCRRMCRFRAWISRLTSANDLESKSCPRRGDSSSHKLSRRNIQKQSITS